MLPKNAGKDGYIYRYADTELAELLPHCRAVSIEGAKSVGKTETAMQHVDETLFLDNPAVVDVVKAQGKEGIQIAAKVCIDEWQKYPPSWDMVRRLVDAHSETKFVLTGSATPVQGVDAHSGAGRIFLIRMYPLALAERRNTAPTIGLEDLFAGKAEVSGTTHFAVGDYAEEICRSGFPEAQDLPPRIREQFLETYTRRLVDRDIPSLGVGVRRPGALLHWLASYGAASSTTADYVSILNGATPNVNDKPSAKTALVYRELLEKMWILDPVPAWLPALTPLRRLTKSAKHHLVDPGLAASLLKVTPAMLLSGQPGTSELLGQLFESLAALSLRAAAGSIGAHLYHLRDKAGAHEIDYILERRDGSVIAFEVKLSQSVSDGDVKHLNWLYQQIGERLVDRVVLHTGRQAYRRQDGVAVIPLAMIY